MPYTVSNFIESQAEVVTVVKDDSVLKALNLMNLFDYSQLPVVDNDQHPLGLITYESVLKGLRNFDARIEDLKVGNVMTQAYIFHLEDTLSDLFERLKLSNAVLILGTENQLSGIVTTYDSTEYFRRYAEDLMLVEDIESMVKDLILMAYTNKDDSLDQENLTKSIKTHAHFGKNKPFEKLSLGEYITLLLIDDNWPMMQKVFDIKSPDFIRNILNGVRKTRNDLAHFQGEISSDQRDQLRFCAEWLGRCLSEYEERLEKNRIKQLPIDIATKGSIQEKLTEELIPSDSRYAPLGIYLQNQTGNIDQLLLSFAEIEEIIGGSLPPTAYNHRNWWDNNPESHPQSNSWLEAGWRAGNRNISAKFINFVRIKEREKAYIDFFSSLLHLMKTQGNVPVRDISPDGTSWIVIVQEAQITFFGFSFARGKRFRVELYIDTGEQESTKQIFDKLYAEREKFDAELGELSWERLDEKRASRIALYHPGQITDSDKKLEALRNWGAETMTKLYRTLSEPLRRVTVDIGSVG